MELDISLSILFGSMVEAYAKISTHQVFLIRLAVDD